MTFSFFRQDLSGFAKASDFALRAYVFAKATPHKTTGQDDPTRRILWIIILFLPSLVEDPPLAWMEGRKFNPAIAGKETLTQ
jgi:hypothetical protein